MTIDLTELFKMQSELGKVGLFAYKGPDRFDKLKLALLVEIGECANEWRGFKFWSTDRAPRVKKENHCTVCDGSGDLNWPSSKEMLLEGSSANPYEFCVFCQGTGKATDTNPLLEEYVDGLHFVMELGLVIHSSFRVPYDRIKIGQGNTTDKFNAVYLFAAKMDLGNLLLDDQEYKYLLTEYVELAEYLGFTWDQVEVAYYEKNKINHKRQESGY